MNDASDTHPRVRNALVLHPTDNIAVICCADGIQQGQSVELNAQALLASDSIPRGHKIALRNIDKGEAIIKLGTTIGWAKKTIHAGQHVHVHNVGMPEDSLVRSAIKPTRPLRSIPKDLPESFLGYVRSDGTVGIRNYIVVVSTVNCSATVTKLICRHFLKRNLEPFGIDGVIPVVDPAGCTQVAGRSHHKLLNRTLAGWMFHPNVVAALVVGLGCEGTTYETIMAATQGKKSHQIPVERIDIQSEGGTRVTIERGIEKIESILGRLPSFRRENRSISHLKVALNCGASDAFSAITANPALGFASDCLVHRGGTVALAEIPECHGAEDLLYQKCVNEIVETKLRSIFNSWTEYTIRHQITLNNNLSEGNIAGGITTIIEKSVGAIAKAGNSALVEVIDYAEPIGGSGFTLMNTPGYDPVSVTGLVAGGCNLVAFTTGRGSVYGCSIAPTLKIATNTEMFLRMKGDMDLNAGSILTHTAIEEIGADIYRMLVHVANGQRTCSEELGLGWEEFIPWSVGEVL